MNDLVWPDRPARPGWQQMAIDLALVEVASARGRTILRLYRWQRDTLSLGANEAAQRTWDRAALARDGVPCVRRPSGGRGVWHRTDDLTYAWAGPSGGPAGVRHRYRDLHDRLAAAMAACGVTAALADPPARLPGLAAGGCFDVAVGGEVLVAGRKAIGSAQKVIGAMLLQHGAMALAGGEGGVAYRRAPPATAHSSQEDPLLDADRVADTILERWLADGATLLEAEGRAEVLEASRRHEARFQDPAWTWRR